VGVNFKDRGDVWFVALVFALGWFFSFNLATLAAHTPPGFVFWSDQDRYLQSARAFARGDLHPDQHWYPLLFPLLLAPFAGLPPLYEALIPDFACYVLAYLGFRRFARGFGLGPVGAAVLFVPTTIAWPHTGDSWIQPWTTTPSAALIWGALALAADVLRDTPRATRTGRMIACGAMLGLIPVSRPGDIVISGIIGLFMLVALVRRGTWRSLVPLVGAALVPLVVAAVLHLAIYGAVPSDYMRLSATYGEQFGRIGWKAYVLLIEPRPWYPEGRGLFAVLPWVPFGLCGIVHAALVRRDRMVAAMTALALLAYCTMALCYMDLVPSGLWRFGNVHYFKWVLPAIGLFGWIALRDARRRPRLTLALVAAMLALTSLRIAPVRASVDEPARLVVFAGPMAAYADIYNAHSTLSDRAGVLRNSFDFHLVPMADPAGRVVGVAQRRDFAGDERWMNPGDLALWPHLTTTHYTDTALPGRFPVMAIARYRPAVGFGLPCWLPPYACPTHLPDLKAH